jgi:hypothetical protein
MLYVRLMIESAVQLNVVILDMSIKELNAFSKQYTKLHERVFYSNDVK